MATQRQKAAIDKIVEKRGVVSSAMRAVGYDDTTAKNPKNLTESKAFKEAQADIISRLSEERDRAIKMMKGKISKAKYRDLVDSADKLTKNIQLLNGGKTSSEEVKITWE